MQAGDSLNGAFMVCAYGTIVSAANGTDCADAAIVGFGLIQLMRQRKALHAEQEQQQCNTHEI
jgi:hypothetical protein